jgi:hypothetical protein
VTVIWDVDDVLNDLMRAWFTETWQPSHPDCALGYADIVENPPDRVLGISRSEYLESLDTYRASEAARNMVPNPAIMEWLSQHGSRCRHIALTARPIASVPHAAEWVFRHFGTYVRAFGVVPSRLSAGSPVYDRTKDEFLRWFGSASVLVDDSAENVSAAQATGLGAILYPQPWNGASGTVADVLHRLSQLVGTQS